MLRILLALALAPLSAASARAQTPKDDPLPPEAIRRLGSSRFRTGIDVRSLAVSPNGKLLAVAGFRSITLLDAVTGKMLREWSHFYADKVRFTSDSKALHIIGTGDGGSRLVDLETEKEFRRIIDKGMTVRRSAISPDGVFAAFVSSEDERLHLWNLETGKPHKSWPAPGSVWYIAWSRDGATLGLVVADSNPSTPHRFLLWDARTGVEMLRLSEGRVGWGCHDFSPTEDLVALAMGWDVVLLLDARSGEVRQRLTGHKTHLSDLAFTADGATLACGTTDGVVHLWEVASAKKIATQRVLPTGGQWLAFAPDGKRLYCAAEGVIRVLDGSNGKPLDDASAPIAGVNRLYFIPEGLFVTYRDYTNRVWDLKTGGHRPGPIPRLASTTRLVFSRDGGKVLWAPDGKPRITDWATGKDKLMFGVERTFTGHYLYGVGWGEDEKTVVAGGDDYGLYVFDANKDKVVRHVKGVNPQVASLSMSPDGKLAFFGEASGHIAVVDVDKGEVRWRQKGASFTTFSPDGRWVAWYSSNGHGVRDAATGMVVRGFNKDRRGNRFAFSPDGRMIASNDVNGWTLNSVRVFEIASGELRADFKGHHGPIEDVAFSPDGTTLASGGADSSILFWDMTGRARLGDLKGKLTEKQLEECWSDLADADAMKAFAAVQRLALSGQAPAFFKTRLTPFTEKAAWLLIAGMGDDLEEGRTLAEKRIGELGKGIEPLLKKAVEEKYPSEEAAKRIEKFLPHLGRVVSPLPSLPMLRDLRAIETLERDGSAAARELIEALAKGLAFAPQTQEAQHALSRLR